MLPQSQRSFFSEITSSISDMKFSRDGRFIMIMPSAKTEATLRERLDKIVRNENPTYSHSIG